MNKSHLIEEMVAKDPVANPWEKPIEWKRTLSFLSHAPNQDIRKTCDNDKNKLEFTFYGYQQDK